jgi:hypothetical protein
MAACLLAAICGAVVRGTADGKGWIVTVFPKQPTKCEFTLACSAGVNSTIALTTLPPGPFTLLDFANETYEVTSPCLAIQGTTSPGVCTASFAYI